MKYVRYIVMLADNTANIKDVFYRVHVQQKLDEQHRRRIGTVYLYRPTEE
jgi:hypothetical protein